MEQSNPTSPQEQKENKHTSLKVFEIVIFVAIVIGALYYYVFYIKNAPKVSPNVTQEQIQKQTQGAIVKRDANLCPSIQSPFGGFVTDAGCVTAIKDLSTLDAVNTTIVRAIKEKNTKLCDTLDKDFKSVCIQAVKDDISGTTKTITNPLLGR